MIWGFETSNPHAGMAALLVYAVYRSRDAQRFKVTPEMWGFCERATKAAAKRAETLGQFVERLKPRLACDTLRPSAMSLIRPAEDDDPREFLTWLFDKADHRAVLDVLYRETAFVILLVRDRLEREKLEREEEAQIVSLPRKAVTAASSATAALPMFGEDA